MRLILLAAIMVLVALFALTAFWAVKGVILRNRVKGLDDPVLHLPRKERRAHARELLEREREQYDLQHQQELIDVINGKLTMKEKSR